MGRLNSPVRKPRRRLGMARLLVSCVLLFRFADAAGLQNALRDHPSPYLALHGQDPVAWQQWNERTVSLARTQDRLMMLSIGYFSCHWCHVMQQESFRDPEIARFLNGHFIPVKIDRELEPALDERMMDFTQGLLGRAGWPLQVFLLPEGYPVYAVLYAPPGEFLSALRRIHAVWQQHPQRVRDLIRKEADAGYPGPSPEFDPAFHARIVQDAQTGVMAGADHFSGGFGDQQKFPSVPQLAYLLHRYRSGGDRELGEFLELTLEAMSGRGLHDHLAGGFFRYAVDPDWETPHFEKMLYDNVGLAGIYLDAADLFDRNAFRETARRTLEFLRTRMRDDSGALISSISSVDGNLEEGGGYLWSVDQVESVLDAPLAEFVREIWGLDQPAEFAAGHHLRFVVSPEQYAQRHGIARNRVDEMYRDARARLLRSRDRRDIPVDGKLIAGWNGLALSLLVRAARVFPDAGYLPAARAVRDFLAERAWDGKRLSRAMAGRRPAGSASIEDYAYVSRGLLDWALFTDSRSDMQLAYRISEEGWRRFHRGHGWHRGENGLLPSLAGERLLRDGATRSPSAVLIETALQLAGLLDDAALRNRALSALNQAPEALAAEPFWHVSQLVLVEKLLDGRGSPQDRVTGEGGAIPRP